jgi:hypothetical protein
MAIAIGRLPTRLRWSFLALTLAAWLPGLRTIYTNRSRNACPLREVARQVGARAGSSDLLLVHSVPSGVVGVARYLESPVPMTSWVGQLGLRRVPESIEGLTAGRERTFLVLVHTVGEAAPEEPYLRARAAVLSDSYRETARIIVYAARPSAASLGPSVDP